MLSDQTRPVVEATLPVVGEHIGEIAERFYRHLFDDHPELLDGTFNRGNQARGSSSRRWPGSVAAFASSPGRYPGPTAGAAAVADRAQARLAGHPAGPVPGRPRQPDVGDRRRARRRGHPGGGRRVGRGLLADGERADQPGARPLQRARRHGRRPSGGDWQVEQKIRETDDVVTFVVKRIDDRLVKTSLPGQYVTVQMPMPDGVRQPRQYSLTRADDGEHRQFSVKRVHGGGKPDGEVSDPAARHRRRRRRADHVAALRRRRARRRRAARWCSPAPASGSPRWPGCSPTWSPPARGLSITLLHADLDEGRVRRCAARSSSDVPRCATRRCTSGTSRARAATSRSTASTPA